jgi:hypothetical protein
MGFNIHILSGRNRSTNLAGHAALAASFNPPSESIQTAVGMLRGKLWSARRGSGESSLPWEDAVMEWVLKLEASNGWGEMETIEVGRLERRVVGLTAEELGLTLAESKTLLGELGRLVLQTQVEEFISCARVCRSCLKLRRLRDQRTRKIQTLFGAITVDAPRISVCSCKGGPGFVDVSWSPLTELLPDRCTPELRGLRQS